MGFSIVAAALIVNAARKTVRTARSSNNVRTQRKLREAGVEAQLQVFEGMSHA